MTVRRGRATSRTAAPPSGAAAGSTGYRRGLTLLGFAPMDARDALR
ncbi:hypothetical protein EV378_2003 [Pseudonocardia endophytica]|uniref:Uncharacterized protein n=1 Tax=Pseudonocardia endophytica TaxID=401976 RepID=A0A4R1HU11_PSEEN|nr:hypothetical protein EV378_2003 [Pseudonocardia endophytica]